MIAVAWLIFAAFALATARHVYRGGTTLNDHFVAAVVLGTLGIYPTLWTGARLAGLSGPGLGALGAALLLGEIGVWGLFFILDRRRPVGRLWPLAALSQPAHAFGLWTGLLLCFWAPAILLLRQLGATGAHPLWPGPALLLPLGLALWGSLWTATHRDRVRRYRLPLPDLQAPVRVVQLSDLHASPVMTAADLRRLVDRTCAEDPDLVVITGDLVMPFSEGDFGFLVDALDALPRPVLICPGNHDLPVSEALGRALAERGLIYLVDQRWSGRLQGQAVEVLGVDFHWRFARERLEAALDAHPPSPGAALRLLLAHDPRLGPWLPPGRFDLVLSGHTHGGQVGAEMFGLRPTLVGLLGARDQGFFLQLGTWAYVHRGSWHTGWPPRMGVAPELAVFELKPGAGAPQPLPAGKAQRRREA